MRREARNWYDGALIDLEEAAALSELTPYYSVARYPNAGLERPWEGISRELASRLLEAAERIVERVGEEMGID